MGKVKDGESHFQGKILGEFGGSSYGGQGLIHGRGALGPGQDLHDPHTHPVLLQELYVNLLRLGT